MLISFLELSFRLIYLVYLNPEINELSHELYLRNPYDFILEAILTLSPNRQYRNITDPTIPADTEPAMVQSLFIT